MDENEILANLMDGGKLIYDKIRYKTFEGEWLRIDLDIYLDD